jgi:signal transduction histidine kinase
MDKFSFQSNLFEILNGTEKQYIKLKKTYFDQEGQISTMIQMFDVTGQVLYDDQKTINQFLNLINATVSHEMRNPLNSIVS